MLERLGKPRCAEWAQAEVFHVTTLAVQSFEQKISEIEQFPKRFLVKKLLQNFISAIEYEYLFCYYDCY